MKEIMAIIRVNMVNPTKEALANAGYPAFNCRKCLGRGKNSVDSLLLNAVLDSGSIPMSPVGECITESKRLIAKRFFTMIAEDDAVEKAVQTIIDVNQTGNPGDGKIFILPINEAYTVRTGEKTIEAY